MALEQWLDSLAGPEALAASELQLLADASFELAARYEQGAASMEDEEGRQTALALSRWRRRRGRYFLELSGQAERLEAASRGAASMSGA